MEYNDKSIQDRARLESLGVPQDRFCSDPRQMETEEVSRYELQPTNPEHHGYEIIIGFEGTLGNFFAQICLPRKDERDLGGEVLVKVIEQLTEPPKMADFDKVVNALSPYAVVDRDLKQKLWDDFRRERLW